MWRALLCIVVAVCVLLAAAGTPARALYAGTPVAVLFEEFKETYQRAYETLAEERQRLANFQRNLERMREYQAKNPHATFGITKFFDMSEEEFAARYLSGAAHFMKAKEFARQHYRKVSADVSTAPPSKDWRDEGAVTRVKDQGSCGSCWAFSAVANIESQWKLAGHMLVGLSEQQLVSCDNVDSGCSGGLMLQAFDWLLRNANGSVFTEKSYPYTSGNGDVPDCLEDEDLVIGAHIDGHVTLKSNEDAMAAWLAKNGPISIAVDATSFQFYKSGILTECNGTQLNHGVLLVGYNMAGKVPYWIIKNSWGEEWGEAGYVRVVMGTNACLLTEYPVSVVVSSGATAAPDTTSTQTPDETLVVEEMMCSDLFCREECNKTSFPTNMCQKSETGGSFLLQCGADVILMRTYPTPDCTGIPKLTAIPEGVCLLKSPGTSKNLCVFT
ncbi:hypothetical protein GH5_07587 [Leishmania sp. Ghana 2012 LV757]|uniref:hypothetical protein n=1 Tax=Leishmania sp. Ghana 2012 LV757 TaxID=2803181 RepID=UPI001B7AB2C2|nr:hypothetical protein GH5_07587 [Leishmania sp. Ghana 2012 LV757]